MDFEEWWLRSGQYIDPDTSDVPWFDKRKALAESAFLAAKALSGNYVGDTRSDPHQVTFSNGRVVASDGILRIGWKLPGGNPTELVDEVDRLRRALQSILSALSPGSSWNEGTAAEVVGIASGALGVSCSEAAAPEITNSPDGPKPSVDAGHRKVVGAGAVASGREGFRAAPGASIAFNPTTGEWLYLARTAEDGTLPGDRRVFEGVVSWERNVPHPELQVSDDPAVSNVDTHEMLGGLLGQTVRVTVDVIDAPKGDTDG